jgi:hypothetical protein
MWEPRRLTTLWACKTCYKDSLYIVTCLPISRHRLGKHIPATNVHATIGYPMLGNGAVNTVFSVGSVPRSYNGTEMKRRSTAEYTTVVERSRVDSRNWQPQKWQERCQEDFTCDVKLQWDCDKSVATKRLVKTENPGACASMSLQVCRTSMALYYL